MKIIQQQRKIDAERKLELEEIKKELSERIVECEEYKQRCYAQKLRNNNLSDELNELKLKITNSADIKYEVALKLRASEVKNTFQNSWILMSNGVFRKRCSQLLKNMKKKLLIF